MGKGKIVIKLLTEIVPYDLFGGSVAESLSVVANWIEENTKYELLQFLFIDSNSGLPPKLVLREKESWVEPTQE